MNRLRQLVQNAKPDKNSGNSNRNNSSRASSTSSIEVKHSLSTETKAKDVTESTFNKPCYSIPTTESLLLNGRFSDITINAFGKDDKLHKIIICNSPFFEDLLCPPDYDESEAQVQVSDSKDVHSFSSTASVSFKTADSSLSEKQELQITEQQQSQTFSFSKNMSQYTGDICSVIRKSDTLYCLNFGCESRITKESFELMLHRLYGKPMVVREAMLGDEMLETGEYFGIPEIIDNIYVPAAVIIKSGDDTDSDQIIDILKDPKNYFRFDLEKPKSKCSVDSDAEISTNRLFDACMCFMLRNGWQLEVEKWDGIPIDTMVDIITKDYFFVPTEFDRALFIIKLIDRRVQVNNDEAAKLKHVLNEDLILSQISSDRLLWMMLLPYVWQLKLAKIED
ncbi:unnamed protein product [Ambrosiozyma monospora]|uniref:Unnamed protein product n=1 Tax=Ambrosiozyma monospora TaxID=43982 RepID=A0ACB5TEL3_AMBMO|nr:unnamed protein product [Ambrosiozyma monospora]